MRTQIASINYAHGHLVGARLTAAPLRAQVEEAQAQGAEVAFDFSSVEATQSSIDELVGVVILRRTPSACPHLTARPKSATLNRGLSFPA